MSLLVPGHAGYSPGVFLHPRFLTGSSSASGSLLPRVPQGSVFGPLLYLHSLPWLPYLVLSHCGFKYHAWTNDSQTRPALGVWAVTQGPTLRRIPTLGLMLYCCNLEILNNVLTRGPHFCFALSPATCMDSIPFSQTYIPRLTTISPDLSL